MQRPEVRPDPDFWRDRGHHDKGEAARRRRRPYRRSLAPRGLRLPGLQLPSWVPRPSRTALAGARTSRRGRRAGSRARPVAAAVLLGALTLGWLVAGHRSRVAGSGAVGATSGPASRAAAATSSTIGMHHECPGRAAGPTGVTCVDGVQLDVHVYSPGTAGAAYRRATGVAAVPHVGPAMCDRGTPDERAWSLPAAPDVAVGRYRCTIVRGHAVMWWTRGDRLTHAVAADADLASLFSWWRAHPAT